MIQKNDKNVIRCTLQSFLGKSIKSFQIGERQEEAIQRLSQLKEDKFNELCYDIVNEIHRRSGLNYDQNSKMNEKFMKLSDQRFKNLIVDTLTVFYSKNGDLRKEDQNPEFLDNLKGLITQLKQDSEKSTFLSKLEKLNFYNKLIEFLEYVKKQGADEQIIFHLQKAVDCKIADDAYNFCEFLSFPKILLEKLSKTEFFNNSEKNELEKYKNTIFSTLSNNTINYKEKSVLIKQDLIKIMTIIINQSKIPTSKIECFDQEIKEMIKLLEKLQKDIEEDKETCFESVGSILSAIIDSVNNKSKIKLGNDNLSEIQVQKISLELLSDMETRSDSYQLVVETIKDIRKVLSQMEE